jgi:hypothetical protein
VLSAGGENNQKTSQIFRPPYLFWGARPTITSAPAQITYGSSFEIFTPDAAAVTEVNLLRPGASTHAYNMSQLFVPLSFTSSADRVTVAAPTTGYQAPPGYYMLFLISDEGVPSVSAWVQLLGSWS